MNIILYIYIVFIGTLLGSFFNVVGIRVPKKETLMGRSHCNNCDHQLGWLELLPIIGYIAIGGKCKNCKSKISIKYPLIELLTGIIFLVSYIILRDFMVEYILIVVFISLMTIVTVSDIYYKIVPDIILVVFLPIILTLRILSPVMPWYIGLLGGILAFGFLYLIALYGKKRFKQDALGGGDIKLYFLIGLVLGVEYVFLSLIFAGIFGIIYVAIHRKREPGYIAFVPFIYAGSLVAYFFGKIIVDYYNEILLLIL